VAEIPIERKSGPNIWPWVIALLVVAALIWYFMSRRNHDNTVTTPGRTDSSMSTTDPGVVARAIGSPAANVFVVLASSRPDFMVAA
jgi:hypothetical protein